jgi:hypothetical protein
MEVQMKTEDVKKTFADKMKEEYAARSIGEQLVLLDARPGKSNREREVLQELLKLPGVTKRTSIKDARALKAG